MRLRITHLDPVWYEAHKGTLMGLKDSVIVPWSNKIEGQ